MRISDWSSDVCSSDLCGWRGTDGWFGAYQIAMFEMRRDPNGAGPVISGFSGLGFRIQDTVYPNGLLLTPQEAAPWEAPSITHLEDRKSVVQGTSVSVRVDLGGHRLIKKKS